MSYPDPTYLAETGEVSARFRPDATEHDIVYPNGTTVDYLATGAGTDGGFGLYRWNMAPGPGGPALHFHRTISESFFILAGTVTLGDGAKEIDARSGDYLYVPPGGLHSFKNTTDEPTSMLLLFSPGAPREGYFEGLLEMAEGKELSEEERAAFFLAHDNLYVDCAGPGAAYSSAGQAQRRPSPAPAESQRRPSPSADRIAQLLDRDVETGVRDVRIQHLWDSRSEPNGRGAARRAASRACCWTVPGVGLGIMDGWRSSGGGCRPPS